MDGDTLDRDERFMREALAEAELAGAAEEVPVGAVVVHGDTIIGRGRNRRAELSDPLAHAEVEALRDAARALGTWRLDDATMYVTLEPCPMCAGALVQGRLGRLVYGAADLKGGAVRSLFQVCEDRRLIHRVAVSPGVLAEECAAVLQRFFGERRRK
ncbi:MAG: nucleoside deaminase [Myxococcales bacterium]|nr:nucleoside deaminase [Myxococcales bacterium]MCB9521567.1 nucleoside deaminase [Myxococcales bacterium]MCB9530563.1 nucleoside deaminase [Myxococcales bacterium]MCB9534488.1 nucleoside deaminase [Myxococcales bacterium]